MDAVQGAIRQMMIAHHLFTTKEKILVAVSGGVDSVVLVRSLHELGYAVAVAHMNYQLRGEESEGDEAFVRKLSAELAIPCFVKKNPPPDKSSIQLWARQQRYAWFEELCLEHGYTHIALGHQADDQIETILLRFLQRGAGVHAMTGIKPKRGKMIRPMLRLSKQAILAYADCRHWSYRNDSSNERLDYDRNVIRHRILPHILEYFPNANKVIQHNAEHWSETAHLQSIAIEKICQKKILHKGNEVHFPILYLQKSGLQKTLLWQYAESAGFTTAQLDEMIRLFDSENGHFVASATHRFIKYQKWLILTALHTQDQTDFIQIDGEGVYQLPFGRLRVKKYHTFSPNDLQHQDKNLALLAIGDKEEFFPLLVRKKAQGDYLYPLGMSKKKKVARLLIDLKCSTTEKENAWVVCHQKRICWVIGHRMDDRYRVLPSSKVIYALELLPK